MRDLIILLVVFLAMMVLGCDSSTTTTNYGSGTVQVNGSDNSNIGNKTPAPVVVTPVVVAP